MSVDHLRNCSDTCKGPKPMMSTSVLKNDFSSSSSFLYDRHNKCLGFGEVEVFEFPVIIGDNPEVSDGCPIALGAFGRRTEVVHVSMYERHRKADRGHRGVVRGSGTSSKRKVGSSRSKDCPRLSVSERAKMLLKAGYSIDEIANGTLEASTSRQQRAETNRAQRWDGVNAFVEYTSRGIKKYVMFGGAFKSTSSSSLNVGTTATATTTATSTFKIDNENGHFSTNSKNRGIYKNASTALIVLPQAPTTASSGPATTGGNSAGACSSYSPQRRNIGRSDTSKTTRLMRAMST